MEALNCLKVNMPWVSVNLPDSLTSMHPCLFSFMHFLHQSLPSFQSDFLLCFTTYLLNSYTPPFSFHFLHYSSATFVPYLFLLPLFLTSWNTSFLLLSLLFSTLSLHWIDKREGERAVGLYACFFIPWAEVLWETQRQRNRKGCLCFVIMGLLGTVFSLLLCFVFNA